VHVRGAPGAVPGHDEQLADHAGPLANILLHKLTSRHADEGAVGVVRHRTRQQRLARARRAIQKHSLSETKGAGQTTVYVDGKERSGESECACAYAYRCGDTEKEIRQRNRWARVHVQRWKRYPRDRTLGWAMPRLSNSSGCLTGSSITCDVHRHTQRERQRERQREGKKE
jgi:hypothetical protein